MTSTEGDAVITVLSSMLTQLHQETRADIAAIRGEIRQRDRDFGARLERVERAQLTDEQKQHIELMGNVAIGLRWLTPRRFGTAVFATLGSFAMYLLDRSFDLFR